MDINVILRYFPQKLAEEIMLMGYEDMQEIRVVADKNCAVVKGGKLYDTNILVKLQEVTRIVEGLSKGSVYALQPSLSKGYITVNGGFRIGVCGKTVTENGRVTHLTDISSLCIRIPREITGAANSVMPYLEQNGKIYNTIIISPPGCGKTTFLRDICRQLGNKYKVCIADERSEIAAVTGGIAQNDVGKYTCVMDCVPKSEGMVMMIRSMSPQIIATDETGSTADEEAILMCIGCGVKIITTAHGYNERDIFTRHYMDKLSENGVFERIIVLSDRDGPGTVEKIIADGRVIRRV